MSGQFDVFERQTTELDSPAVGGFAVTPSDITVFTRATRAIYIGGTGNLAVVTLDGSTLTFIGMVQGSILPMRVKQVLSTGTTSINIVGIY
jgi:hypothetical protein